MYVHGCLQQRLRNASSNIKQSQHHPSQQGLNISVQQVVCLSLRAIGSKSARWSRSRQLYDPEIKLLGQFCDDKELEDQSSFQWAFFCMDQHNAMHASNLAKFSKTLGAFKPGKLGDTTAEVVPRHAATLALVQQQPLQAVSVLFSYTLPYTSAHFI